jgi:hypothetical protein
MRLNRIGAICAFVLTIQFLATLGWIVVSLPAEGLGGLDKLADAMAAFFKAYATRTLPFMILNLYNASFAFTAVVLVIILRERLAQARLKMQFSVIAISVAAALFLASGIIPIVSGRTLVELNDVSALRATIGVVTGLVLAATTAAGFGVALTAWSGLETGRLPAIMCWLMIIGGLMEIAEFTAPLFLILDPSIGTVWSLWLGFFLWRTDA